MLRLFALAALALFSGLAPAKNLYVNNSGTPSCSDATTYAANDAANPWCTVGRAAWGSTSQASPSSAQAAAAGDTVNITAGTYLTTSQQSTCGQGGMGWNVALNPENSGTSGNLISFVGSGTVNIRLDTGYAGSTIGADNRSYIAWDNVRIDDDAAAGKSCEDHGPVLFHVCTGCQFKNSYVYGRNPVSWNDNYNAVRIEAVLNTVISGNELTHFGYSSPSHNVAAIMLYDSENAIVEHNYIHDNDAGIYIKGEHTGDGWPQQNNVFRFNWIENSATDGIVMVAGTGSDIYQNVIKNAVRGLRIDTFPSPQSENIDIVNNTFIATAGGFGGQVGSMALSVGDVYTHLLNIRVYNNIFAGPWPETINLGGMTAVGSQTYEHNVYYGYTNWGSLNGSLISLATWKATYSQDSASPAAITSNPDFAATSYPGGYKLNVGSPALTQGVDILDLDGDSSTSDTVPAGAYISGSEVIGIGGSSLLPGPGNVRFRPRASLWYWFTVGMVR